MKKTAFAAAAVALFAMATACSDKANNTEATEAPAKKTAKAEGDSFAPTTNIRY